MGGIIMEILIHPSEYIEDYDNLINEQENEKDSVSNTNSN